ncbi:DUF6262 family protein [Streptomyces avermitilis]|uniref:DUF6262 family protein n=1 Tax=Streptomyces avermitilis TaxID=33903 RepID=UPI0033B8E546
MIYANGWNGSYLRQLEGRGFGGGDSAPWLSVLATLGVPGDDQVECSGHVLRVHQAITRLRREKAQVSVAALARRADVSRTFLYDNVEARAAVAAARRTPIPHAR